MSQIETIGAFLEGFLPIAVDLLTILALVFAGLWFYQRRERLPRAVLGHELYSAKLPGSGGWLLHVSVTVENRGNVLVTLKQGLTRVQQIDPVGESVLEALEAGRDPVPEGESEVPWLELGQRDYPTKEHPVTIEPGERDQIAYDFFLPAETKTVEIYTHYPNPRTEGESGWQLTTVYELGRAGIEQQGGKHMSVNPKKIWKQQRPKPAPDRQQSPKPQPTQRPTPTPKKPGG